MSKKLRIIEQELEKVNRELIHRNTQFKKLKTTSNDYWQEILRLRLEKNTLCEGIAKLDGELVKAKQTWIEKLVIQLDKMLSLIFKNL
jgi:predicted nuclease with TOPRIM domain